MNKKILIVANNNTWKTWLEKEQYIQNFYNQLGTFDFTLINTTFTNIPILEQQVNGNVNGVNQLIESYVVDPVWYDLNIKGSGYDCVIFVLNTTDTSPQSPLLPPGLYHGIFLGVGQISMFVQPNEENTPGTQSGQSVGNFFSFIVCHELSHYFYQLAGIPDNTHKYFYSTNPSGVISELMKPLTIVNKIPVWAQTIQTQEGGKPTDRNMINNNPGNLKFTSYTKSLGATHVDTANFCVFPSYQVGFNALTTFLTDACLNRLVAYHNATIHTFTETYAEPPNSDYENAVSLALGVPVDTLISTFIK